MKSLAFALFILLGLFTSAYSQVISFSHKGGFFNSTFQLQMVAPVGASIYFTTDCSTPTASHGTVYRNPITISTTTIVRAIAVSNSVVLGQSQTQSYLFPNDIIKQNNSPSGYPTQWGPYTAIAGNAKADYEMDQDVLSDLAVANEVKKSFLESPSVSLVTDIDNLFSSKIDSVLGGIYMYTGAPITNFTYANGRGWERPASVEFFENDTSFQLNCGIRLQGGHSRRPEKNPKHSFLLEFDSEYGPSKLNFPYFGINADSTIENFILKSGFGNTWIHHDNTQRIRSTYQEDVWAKDTQRAMGHPSASTRYVHLFLNGIYWGMYLPSERMDKEFGEHYFGGDEDDYDVIKDYAEVSDGTIDAWNKMMDMANAGLESNQAYLAIQGKKADGSPDYNNESLVDLISLADYMLINFYGGNSDWDHHNWAAMRNRTNPGNGFKFLSWDAEMIFSTVNVNVLSENNANCPSRVYQQLIKNESFKRLFADRIQKHCFNDGVFTADSAASRWQKRKDQIFNMVLAESARWGDYRRDVHSYQSAGPFDLYTRDNHWVSRQNFIQQTFFPQRLSQFLSQLRTAGLFPTVDAPGFKINNKVQFQKEIVYGDQLSLASSQGTVYYSLNGADPVDLATNQPSAEAVIYKNPINLSGSCLLVARTFLNGKWSAALRRSFVLPQDYTNLKLTEINYKPIADLGQDKEDFEFLELKNVGQTILDLSSLKFTDGVDYQFKEESVLNPGEFVVLASNSNQFLSRYGFRPWDEYNGKLNNAGELLQLMTESGQSIFDIAYSSVLEWPQEADGQGYSLVPLSQNPSGNQNDPKDWRASSKMGGSPGEDDLNSVTRVLENFVSYKPVVHTYPLPFKDLVYFDILLNQESEVRIEIYNLSGQKVKRIQTGRLASGLNQLTWDGSSENNDLLTEGVYLYKVYTNSARNNEIYSGKLIKSY